MRPQGRSQGQVRPRGLHLWSKCYRIIRWRKFYHSIQKKDKNSKKKSISLNRVFRLVVKGLEY